MNSSKDQIESIATVIDNSREILKIYFIFLVNNVTNTNSTSLNSKVGRNDCIFDQPLRLIL